MNLFAVTVIGKDRPGIVAAVSHALYQARCNIQDSQMSILRGHFAMMLLVEAPQHLGQSDLSQALEPAKAGCELEAVSVNPIEQSDTGGSRADYVVTVYGADHPGIVASVSEALAALDINIVDLKTRLVGESSKPLYAMILELVLPAGLKPEQLEHCLDEVGAQNQVEISINPYQAESL